MQAYNVVNFLSPSNKFRFSQYHCMTVPQIGDKVVINGGKYIVVDRLFEADIDEWNVMLDDGVA